MSALEISLTPCYTEPGLPWLCAHLQGRKSQCLVAFSSPQAVLELLGTEPDQPFVPFGGMCSRRELSRMDLSEKGRSVCSVWPGSRVSILLCHGYLRMSASRVPTAWRPWVCHPKALACLRLPWDLGHL